MKIETLKFRKRKYFLCALVVGVLLLLPLVLSITFGKYQTKESIKLAEGTISYKPYDFKIMAMYQENENGEYEEIEIMPTSGYVINEEKSYCTIDNINKDSNVLLRTIDGNHTFNDLSKNEKCYIWFDRPNNIEDLINSRNISYRNLINGPFIENTTGTMFIAEDNDGISYYFAGIVNDNWVKFADIYWRIVRINGDKTMRLIYNGTSTNQTGQETVYAMNIKYNNLNNDNMYAGYMFTSGEAHGNDNSSNVKLKVDEFFDGLYQTYKDKIDINSGFCNDRENSTEWSIINNQGGIGIINTTYGAMHRLYIFSDYYNKANPTFKCNNNDIIKTGAGLITADEVVYAGGYINQENNEYYLNNNYSYWTMSPDRFNYDENIVPVYQVGSAGQLWNISSGQGDTYAIAVRPVINLKADTQFSSGDGTSTDPYIVS